MARAARGVKDATHPAAHAARSRVPLIIDAISPVDLVNAIKRAPSLRGMILGYIAEEMFEQHVLQKMKDIDGIRKHDNHDRINNKSDREFVFDGRLYSVQLKSIQTNSIVWRSDEQRLTADVQNDGSDRRMVKLPNGRNVETTNYRIGDFDILAVPLFPFSGIWNFAYKNNSDCRMTESPRYDEETRQYLLASTEKITWPLADDWTTDLTSLFDGKIGKPIS
jgi:hypothetical protein